MEHITMMRKRTGVDVGYHSSNLYPKNIDCRVGKGGIDKTYTLAKMIEIAYEMEDKPNIIIKSGKNGKWYLKKFQKEEIEDEIVKQKAWRDTSRCTMYMIEWE